MTRSNFLAGRLQEVLLDGHWIANTNYKNLIESLNWRDAIYKVYGLNTIHALTFHINYYLSGILNVFNGGELEIRDKYSFDAPEIKSEEDWQELIKAFIANSENFVEKVEQMPDSKLDEHFVDPKYGTYQRNIEGVIEHAYYHLGQISLIKKMITSK